MPDKITQLNSKRTLGDRFNQAARLLNDFKFKTYHRAATVEREKMKNALRSDMMNIIMLDEVEGEMIELTLDRALSGVFSFMSEGSDIPSEKNIEHAKTSGQNHLTTALKNEASLLGLDLKNP